MFHTNVLRNRMLALALTARFCDRNTVGAFLEAGQTRPCQKREKNCNDHTSDPEVIAPLSHTHKFSHCVINRQLSVNPWFSISPLFSHPRFLYFSLFGITL